MIANLREHTDAVIAALEAAGLTVYDGVAPATPATKYAVVHHINDEFSGTLEEPFEDARLVYQVTCVATTREQVEWVMDRVMVLLNGFEVDGRHIAFVRPDGGPGIRWDPDVTPAVFYATPRFTVTSTPDPEAISA